MVSRIVTDAGPAHLKALGNPQGPHVLACDLLGTGLARWLGLPTFDFVILMLDISDEIPLHDGGRALPGPAFATRSEKGTPWSGSPEQLDLLDNPEDLSRLVVLDTWLRNCDRHPPDPSTRNPNYDNVFLSEENASPGRFRLVAMDHGHCFTCGRELTAALSQIEQVRDERVYGLFPAFTPRMRSVVLKETFDRLSVVPTGLVDGLIAQIPDAWEVKAPARAALRSFVLDRAEFLAAQGVAMTTRLAGGARHDRQEEQR